jgi:hypothetical protein
LLGMTKGRVALPLIVVTWDGQTGSTDVHSSLNLTQASHLLGMTNLRVGFYLCESYWDGRKSRSLHFGRDDKSEGGRFLWDLFGAGALPREHQRSLCRAYARRYDNFAPHSKGL